MAILTTDIKCYLSGGAGNSNPSLSLGGVRSSTEMDLVTLLNNLWDDVSGSEASAGDAEVRCVYIYNAHATLTLQNPVIWLSTDVVDTGHITIQLGLDPAGVGDGSTTGVATTVADEGTMPTGVTFSKPTSKATGLVLGDLGPGQCRAVWVKRTIAASTPAANSVSYIVRAEGDTAA